MARPCKSAKILTDYSQTKDEINSRIEQEDKLKGNENNISPPKHLSKSQKDIFNYIVKQLKASGILGCLDIYILTTCSIAIDRMQEIEKKFNENIENMMDKDLIKAKEMYTKEFFRCCNELSLSPQSRAKLANITVQAREQEIDPVMELIKGD